jgi:peptide/nickel transport system permease protein
MYWRFLLRRLITLLINLWLVATLVFLLFRFLPGDPTAMFLDPLLSAEVREAILRRFGLDRPLHEQYFLYMRNLLRGDFGWSFYYNRPVAEIIWTFLPNTIVLAGTSLVLAYVVGILGGALLAWKRNTWFGDWGTLIPLFFRSTPVFWTGMVALMYLSYRLGWFPHRGLRTPGYEAIGLVDKFLTVDFLHHLALPAIISALYYMGLPMLLTRTSMLEVFGEEFVELARARGLSNTRIMLVHVLRNALLPVTTATAVAIGLAVGGNIVVEYVFSWPGIGREIVVATQNRDYPMAQGMFIIIALTVMVANTLADIAYAYLDPRVVYD